MGHDDKRISSLPTLNRIHPYGSSSWFPSRVSAQFAACRYARNTSRRPKVALENQLQRVRLAGDPGGMRDLDGYGLAIRSIPAANGVAVGLDTHGTVVLQARVIA